MKYSDIDTEKEFIDFINLIDDVNALDEYNQSLIYNAAQKGFPHAVILLCEQGADVNGYNNHKGNNVLDAACGSGNIELIYYLLDKGAKVVENCTTPNGTVIMHGSGIISLLFSGHDDLVKLLLEKGWSPLSSSLNGPLVTIAIQQKNLEILKLALEKGAVLNEYDIDLAMKSEARFEFIDVLLNSKHSPMFLEKIFSNSSNLFNFNEIILPLIMEAVKIEDNYDIDLVGEQIVKI